MLNRRMSEELQRFYKNKAKKPNLFSYDDNGNLIELNNQGAVIKTIPLPIYRHPTYEEFNEMEQKRIEDIAIANKEFEDAKKELRALINSPQHVESEILRINRKVTDADIKLQGIRFPLRYISSVKGISINDVDFNQPNETRKYPYDFHFLQVRPFTLQDQYVRIGELPDKPLLSLAEIQSMSESAPVILFAEPETNEYGYLSLKWVVQIEFNATIYNSVYQALYAEIAKSFNDQDNLRKIMIADTPNAISYSLENVPGDADVNEPKWNDLTKQLIMNINIEKFKQYPELTERLLQTKSATLGAYIPDDNLIGIGISLDNIQSKNPVNWTGQNILGKALMDIREKVLMERTVIQQAPVRRRKKPGVASITPVAPTESIAPITPIVPITVASIAPIAPVAPITPVAPTESIAPVVPITAVAPVKPTGRVPRKGIAKPVVSLEMKESLT